MAGVHDDDHIDFPFWMLTASRKQLVDEIGQGFGAEQIDFSIHSAFWFNFLKLTTLFPFLRTG